MYQFVTLNQTTAKPLCFSVWSMASNVTGTANYQYSAYLVLVYSDGTTSLGYFAPYFPVGTQGWSQTARVFTPPKPVTKAELCLVINGDHTGTVWFDDASLSEAAAPAITTQPANLTSAASAQATLTVAASGYPSPTYQWESSQDGSTWTAISGAASASYTFTCQASLNGSQYHAKATNALGTATSSAATLTVGANGGWTVFTPLASTDDLAQGANLLTNSSLETVSGSAFTGWSPFTAGSYVVDTTTSSSGSTSAKCVASATGQWHGLYQTVTLNQTTAHPLVFSAWSKASGVTGTADYQYAAYVVLTYTDGTSSAGYYAPYFPVGTQAWNRASKVVIPAKPVKQASIYLAFNKSHTGTVWFDDASLSESSEQAYTFEEITVKNVAAASYPYQGVASLTLSTSDGLSLGLSSTGGVLTSLKGSSGEMTYSGSLPASGFFLKDVAASSDYIHPSTTVTKPASDTLSLTAATSSLGLNLLATFTASADHISVEGTVSDSTGKDRAVTLYFALPVDCGGWTWGDDIRANVTLGSNQERGKYTEVPFGPTFKSQLTPPDLTGRMSLYPLASIVSGDGLALAYPLDRPAQIRLVANTSTRQFFLAYDLGLSQYSKTPGTAPFSFVIFRHDPAWGFRAAWSKYASLYPDFFKKRVATEGIWIAGGNISTISGLADFHVAFHELTGNLDSNLLIDNQAGVAGLRYNYTPSSYPLEMTSTVTSSDYATVMAALTANLTSTNTSLKNAAIAVMSSAMVDGNGQMVFTPLSSRPGALFTMDPDPDVSDPTYQLNSASYRWNSTQKAIYSRTTGGILDGEYVDSLEYTPSILDYRHAHLAASDLPLVFDSAYRPAVPEIWASYEFARWMASDVHALNKLMMANGALGKFAFPAHAFDVMGWETDWLNSSNQYSAPADAWFNFRRTLSYQKPYCLLMETDFSVFTNALMKQYLQTCLFYGIYPSVYSVDGYPTSPIYWDDSSLVERDRALFKLYIPLIQKLGQAGWEPVTRLRSSNSNVAVERYGSGSSLYFTLRNLSSDSQTATLTLETAALGLSSPPANLAELLGNGSVSVNTAGPSFSVTLGADEVRIYTPE